MGANVDIAGSGLKLRISASIPELALVINNEDEAVRAMAFAVSTAVVKSLNRGKDAYGRPMPPPKDGGTNANKSDKPMIRSGMFVKSIAPMKRKSRSKASANPSKRKPVKWIVKAVGKRTEDKNLALRKRRAREKTKQLRAAAVLGEAFGALATGRGVQKGFSLEKRRKGIKLGRIKVRTADTNSALAGILSVRPRDERSKKGGRHLYRVLIASERYVRLGHDVSNKMIGFRNYRLKQIGVKKVKL